MISASTLFLLYEKYNVSPSGRDELNRQCLMTVSSRKLELFITVERAMQLDMFGDGLKYKVKTEELGVTIMVPA